MEPILRFSNERLKSKIVLNLLWQPRRRGSTNQQTFMASKHDFNAHLGVFWSNFIKIVFFSNLDFFLKILPLKDDELVMSEM